MIFLNKKAAMFGLDARVALAVFATLSIAITATLFRTLKEADVTKTLSLIDQIAKAESRYNYDTGITLPADSGGTNDSLRRIEELVDNTLNTDDWDGPYLPFTIYNDTIIATQTPERVKIRIAPDTTWGDTTDVPTFVGTCTDCYIWVQYQVYSTKVYDAIEETLDGDSDPDDGNVRYIPKTVAADDTGLYFMYVKGRAWEGY